MELTALTGKNIDTWQEDATAKNDEEDLAEAQYQQLLPQVKDELESGDRSTKGLLLMGFAMLGSAAFMRWKGLI